MMTEPWMSR